MGGLGGGKSSGCVIEIIRRAQAQAPGPDGIKRSRWAVIRNTIPQLRDTTIRTVFQWLPPEYFGRYYQDDARFVVKAFEGCEFEIMFRGLDRPDDVKKLLSMELTGAWVNEAREVPWSIIDALQGRVGRFPAKVDGGATWHGIWMDTNPPDADSKFYKFFEEMKHPPGFARIFKQPSGLAKNAENISNLPANYYTNLANGKSPEWISVYIHGEYGFVMDGKPVFPDYKDQTHCRSVEPVSGPPIYRGWDFGLTPFCSFHQVLPDGRWLIFDEICADNMGIDRFSDQVLHHCSRSFPPKTAFIDIGDPAGNQRAQTDEKTVFSILQAKGIDIEPGEQTLALRLEAVRKPLNSMIAGEPQFVLHPRCKILRKGFLGAYHYRRLQTSADKYTNEPDKSHPISDGADSVQYVATRLFGDALTSPRQDFDPTYPTGYMDDRGRSNVTGY